MMYTGRNPFGVPAVGANTAVGMLPMPSPQVAQGMQQPPLNNGE